MDLLAWQLEWDIRSGEQIFVFSVNQLFGQAQLGYRDLVLGFSQFQVNISPIIGEYVQLVKSDTKNNLLLFKTINHSGIVYFRLTM